MNERLALIIANSEYQDTKLGRTDMCIRDADMLRTTLGNPAIGNFEVHTLVNEPFHVVRREIVRFYRDKKPNDLLLLYFSGHSVMDDTGELHLVTKDTELEYLDAASIDAVFLHKQISKSRSRSKIVLLDCDNGGAFMRNSQYSHYGLAIMTSTDRTQFAWTDTKVESSKAASLFTRILTEGLQSGAADFNNDGLITFDEAFEYTFKQMAAENEKQTPQKWLFSFPGQTVFARHDLSSANMVFISYARKDADFAHKLNLDLQQHGVNTWMDQLGIRGGDDWPDRIAEAIDRSKIVLVILSPDAVASKWVTRELSLADGKGKKILPLIYRPSQLPGWFELRFGNTQRTDFSQGEYESNLSTLLKSLRDVFGVVVRSQ